MTDTAVATTRSARFRRVMEGLRIRNESGRIVPMRFSRSQEMIWRQIAPRLDTHEKLWFVCLKGRQLYASTLFQALTFVRTVEQPGTNSLVVAQDLETANDLFSKSKLFFETLPLPKLVPGKVAELIFPFPAGASRFKVISSTAAKGRGTTQTCIHLSECAYWQNPEVMTGLLQAMPDLPDTILVLESTANGMQGRGEAFYEEWQRATRGESDLVPIFLPWWAMEKYRRTPAVPMDDWDEEERLLAEQFDVDGEQLAWRRYAIKTKCRGSRDVFAQEYPASPEEAFVATGIPAFDRLAVMRQRSNIRDPSWRGDFVPDDEHKKWDRIEMVKGPVRLWKHPEEGHKYVIGADTSEGIAGGDYSCAEILDMETLEQVGSVHGHIPYYEFAVLLNAVGRYFNRALLCIEVYPQGHTVQDYLIRKFAYPSLHQWRGKPDAMDQKKRRLWGYETNVWSRPLLIGSGQRAINGGLVVLHEDGLLDEIIRFSKVDNGKYEASAGHDDRVIALLLALRSREENYIPARRPQPYSAEMDALPTDIRVIEARDTTADARRRISKILRERAKQAVKTWLEL